jgi:hypothetical protein
MKIYLACALTHVPRQLFNGYVAYLHRLARALHEIGSGCTVKYALVNSDPQLAEKPCNERASLCYAWDRRMVEEADLVVADASFPSTGRGVKLQIAHARGPPIIMLVGDYGTNRVKTVYYEDPDPSQHDLQVGEGMVSLMALGVPSIRCKIGYSVHETAIDLCVEAVKVIVP